MSYKISKLKKYFPHYLNGKLRLSKLAFCNRVGGPNLKPNFIYATFNGILDQKKIDFI